MISMLYHLTVLYLISIAGGEVSSTTNPSSFPTRSPTTSNRLLETAPYHHCPIPEWHDSDCADNTILAGTQCKIWFICRENQFPIPALQTCQENKEWAGEEPDRNCQLDPCPIIEGFQMYATGGCEGRNEIIETPDESLNDCRTRCLQEDTCVSFEYAKAGFEFHVEHTRCALSTTCTYDESVKLRYSDKCLYVKGLNVDGDDATPISNHDGEHTHFRHCAIEGDLAKFTTLCDGNILAGTRCDFEYLCKESQHSKKATLTCKSDGTWEGEYDPNCYVEPTRQPTYTPFFTERDICEEVCPNSPSCGVCYDEEVPPTHCPPRAVDCVVERVKTTTTFVEESRCISYSMSAEMCAENGGDFVVKLQICVMFQAGQEKCTTEGGETGVSMSSAVKMSAGEKACHLILGVMCDEESGLQSLDRVVLVPADQPCPTIQNWPVSCNLLAESNEVIPAPKDTPPVPDDDDGVCLAYDSDVSLADGTTQPIHSLQVGTNVALGNDDQSAIVFFSHADKAPVMRNMVTIKTQETNITATRKHLIFSSENKDVTLRNLRAFEEVKIGDYVLMDSQSGPVSTKVTDIIYQRMFTRVFNAVPKAGYLIANKIFVASGVAFWVLPHWLQYPVVHAVSMLVCGISERSCQIEENETKPRWVRSIQEWIAAMDLNRVSSAMMLTGSYA